MFKDFCIKELFDVINNPQLDKGNFVFSESAEYPYFTRTENNNGILGYVEYLDEEHKIRGNSLAVGMISMKFHYMQHDFYAGQFTKTLIPKFQGFDEKIALYFMAILNKHSAYYQSYLVRHFKDKVSETVVSLPVIESSEYAHEYTTDDIDWLSIRNRIVELENECISDLEQERIAELDAYLAVSGLDDYELTDEDRKVLSKKPSYASFEIGSVFEPLKVGFIGKGQKIGSATKEPDEEHCVPLTCAKIGDNGIMYWGKKGDFITYKNTLAVIADGAVSAGLVYAQPEEAGAYSHSYFIDTKTKGVSKYAKEYLSTVLTKVVYPKYSREDAPRWNKIEKDVIYLPVTSNGDIDFDYMERYIRVIEKLAIADVVKYRDRQIAITKQIVSVVSV